MKYTLKTLKIDLTSSAQRLSASNLWVKSCSLQASTTNTGTTYVGASDVTTSIGHQLTAGKSLALNTVLGTDNRGAINLYDLWALSSVASGDDLIISYLYEDYSG
jgi:hypothetical protein